MKPLTNDLHPVFTNALHPASGWAKSVTSEKAKKKHYTLAGALDRRTPDCCNIRGFVKDDPLRYNPMP